MKVYRVIEISDKRKMDAMENLAQQLNKSIYDADTLQGKFTAESFGRLTWLEQDEFEKYLAFRIAQGDTIQTLTNAYLEMVDGVMGEQLYFFRNGRYRYSMLGEVESHVYADPSYMSRYVLGIAISLYLWPQHQEIKRFFQKALPSGMGGVYLEVGPGHGMFFLRALESSGFARHIGIDISSASIASTRTLLESGAFGHFTNYELIHADFLSIQPPELVMACVAGEVLEHVEEPGLFLEKFHQCVAPGGFVFISTCINAPVIDHIYNFDTVEGLEEIIVSAGLAIDDRILIPHVGTTIDQCVRKKLPLSMAYVLRKA